MEENRKRTINPAAVEKLLHFPPHLYFQVLTVNWVAVYLKTTGPMYVKGLKNSLIQSLNTFIHHIRYKCSVKTFFDVVPQS